jgi:hypothetical protein
MKATKALHHAIRDQKCSRFARNKISHQQQQQQQQQQQHQQLRCKNTSSKNNNKSRSISRTLQAQTQNQKQKQDYIFGLRPVDVSILPPLHRPPPPPPPKPGAQRLVFPLSVLTLIGTVGFFYFNNKNDSYEYWEAMQTGGVFPGTDDDDDDDDEFDDDEFEDDEE